MGVRSVFGNLGLVADLVDGIDGQECLGVILADVIHQQTVFVLVHDGDDLLADRAVVCADGVVDGCAAVEGVEDEMHQLVVLVGNDAHPALQVQAEDEVVNDHTAKVGAQDAEDNGLGIVNQGGGNAKRKSGTCKANKQRNRRTRAEWSDRAK